MVLREPRNINPLLPGNIDRLLMRRIRVADDAGGRVGGEDALETATIRASTRDCVQTAPATASRR